MARKLPPVSATYGAPMGRASSHPGLEPEGRVSIQRVRLDSGGYDSGGAYWGLGAPVYWATDESGGFEWYQRARYRNFVKTELQERFPEIRFYR